MLHHALRAHFVTHVPAPRGRLRRESAPPSPFAHWHAPCTARGARRTNHHGRRRWLRYARPSASSTSRTFRLGVLAPRSDPGLGSGAGGRNRAGRGQSDPRRSRVPHHHGHRSRASVARRTHDTSGRGARVCELHPRCDQAGVHRAKEFSRGGPLSSWREGSGGRGKRHRKGTPCLRRWSRSPSDGDRSTRTVRDCLLAHTRTVRLRHEPARAGPQIAPGCARPEGDDQRRVAVRCSSLFAAHHRSRDRAGPFAGGTSAPRAQLHRDSVEGAAPSIEPQQPYSSSVTGAVGGPKT
jgi:hypothetical protein